MLYGSVIPSYPARRVLKKANRLAVELNVGDWRKRKHPKLYVALDAMEAKVRDRALTDPSQSPAVFERQILLNSIEDRLGQEAQTGMQLIYQLLRRGFSWQDIARSVVAVSWVVAVAVRLAGLATSVVVVATEAAVTVTVACAVEFAKLPVAV